MPDQSLITAYLNELACACQQLCRHHQQRYVEIHLADLQKTVVAIRSGPKGTRFSGRIADNSTVTDFELLVRPRRLQFIYALAGHKASLYAPIDECCDAPLPEDLPAKIQMLARRLKHFTVMKRVQVGIRETLPPPASSVRTRKSDSQDDDDEATAPLFRKNS